MIIDFTDTQLGEVTSPITVNNGVVNEITASQFDDVSSSLSRIVIGFDNLVDYEVTPKDNALTVSISKQGASMATSQQTTAPAVAPADMGTTMAPSTAEKLEDIVNEIPVEGEEMAAAPEASPMAAEIPPASGPATKLTNVGYTASGDTTVITLIGDGSFENVSDFMLDNPKRLVVDLKGVKTALKKGQANLKVNQGMVAAVRTGGHADKSRVVVDFAPDSTPNYQVNKVGSAVEIMVGTSLAAAPEAPAAEAAPVEAAPSVAADIVDISNLPLEDIPVEGTVAAAPAPAAEEPAAEVGMGETAAEPMAVASGPYSVVSLDFVQQQGGSRLVIKTTAPATYTTAEEGADTVIINLSKGRISKPASRYMDTSAFNSPVARIVPKQVGQDTRIVASLREAVPYKVTQEGNFLYVDFERTHDFTKMEGAEGAAAGPPAVAETAAPTAPELGETPALAAPAAPAEATPPPAPADISEDEAFFESKAATATPEEPNNKFEYVKESLMSESLKSSGGQVDFGDDMIFEGGGSSKIYKGKKINLDFKDADIRSLFRLFADISKLNIIVGDDVNGHVTIRLKDVPWDQAFAILLQTQSLGAIKYGNIIRIAPADKIQKERELHTQAKKAAIAAAPMDTLFKAVSYAGAAEIASHVKSVLSDRGTVNIDARTNTLIIRDVREKLIEAKALMEKLDAQTPQVTIEARIVEASDTFVRNWGVAWGARANFTAATGNPTGLLFPNGVTVQGSQSATPVAGGKNPILLNYPPTGANAEATINLGSINNVLDLDLLLGYEESEGNAKLISSPKVTVLDNRPATILSGKKIPFITTTANSGNNVRFESAVIQISVTPHITADGSVIMQVAATRNEPDFGQTVFGNPTIVQREANTEVLVKSGNTTVIGGIYSINRARAQSGFPFLRKVPILGWFFSSDNRRLDRQELLIFITPRIVGDERTVVRQVQG